VKLFAITIVALRTSDVDIQFASSLLECNTVEEAIGIAVKRMNVLHPNHAILPPSFVEITKTQMEGFLQRNQETERTKP
jgi:hypothetical protein